MYNKTKKQQKGIAALTVSIGIALLMAVAAVGMLRSSLLEKKITANDLRAREAQEIAQAGLESIMVSNYSPSENCIINNTIPDLSNSKFEFKGVLSVPIRQVDQTSEEDYISSIRWCSSEGYYFARSQVELNSGFSKTEYFAEAWFQRSSLINGNIGIPAPFLINGDFCSSEKNNEECRNGEILNSRGIIDDEEDSPGIVATGKINRIFFDEYQADKEESFTVPDGKSAWEYVFPGITLDKAKEKAGQANNGGWFYFNEHVHGNYGSAESPVIVIVGRQPGLSGDCYKINGGTVIYGVVYFADQCKANGWGNSEIHGSIISDGDIDKLTGQPKFYKFSSYTWNKLKDMNNDGVFVVPGTWKDF